MCGIVGFLSPKKHSSDLVEKMANEIFARGPDSFGKWIDNNVGVHFAHRRLAILDLTPAGHQPIHSACGRYTMVFNGEIYNHIEIRDKLSFKNWRGSSDSETLVNALTQWGLEKTLQESIGMFALAVWDHDQEVLMLARDRMGEKPLYYGFQGESFLFSSDLKAMRPHPDFRKIIDRDALSLYFKYNYVPAPYSIYKDLFKLEPGSYLTLRRDKTTEIKSFWSFKDVVEKTQQFQGDETECVDQLEKILGESVKGQMLSDVELGAFLSGGVDSSTIVALMQKQSQKPVKTFTIGFNEQDFNEARHAKAIAQHLKTEHTELYLSAKDALDVVLNLPSIYSEPFADSSQIPTFLVSQLAKKHVTVSLSGDGGDELFCGYNRYLIADKMWGKLQHLPKFAKSLSSKMIYSLAPQQWSEMAKTFSSVLPKRYQHRSIGEKIHKIAKILDAPSREEVYRRLVSVRVDSENIVRNTFEPISFLNSQEKWPQVDSFTNWMMAMDTLTYLPDDILVKVDRAAMANSLETRVPLLDHRVVEFAWSIPTHYKIKDGQTKWPLRQILYRHVPKELIERPKVGFGIPLDQWLRGPLLDWAESLLSEGELIEQGFLDSQKVLAMWSEHKSKKNDWGSQLWSVLMFQAWLASEYK